MTSFLDQPVRQFLDQVAARTPAPGGGAAAAVSAGLAAGLVAMAARFSGRYLPGAGEVAERADQLRRRAAGLADADARAYQAVLDAQALPREYGQRQQQVQQALRGAAAVPLEITQIAAQLAEMASLVGADGHPKLRGDIIAAALLADASARCAACLVDINVDLGGLDPDLSRRAALSAAITRRVTRQITASDRSRG